jgi:hypothetical protein
MIKSVLFLITVVLLIFIQYIVLFFSSIIYLVFHQSYSFFYFIQFVLQQVVDFNNKFSFFIS